MHIWISEVTSSSGRAGGRRVQACGLRFPSSLQRMAHCHSAVKGHWC